MREKEINELFNDILAARAEIQRSYAPHTERSDNYELAKILSEKYFTLKEGFKPIWLNDDVVIYVKKRENLEELIQQIKMCVVNNTLGRLEGALAYYDDEDSFTKEYLTGIMKDIYYEASENNIDFLRSLQ